MIKNLILLSDIHSGDRFSVCPPTILLHEGGSYKHSKIQKMLWPIWEEFTNVFIPHVTDEKDYNLAIVGDLLEGLHHNMVHAITNDSADHFSVAEELLRPLMMNAHQTLFIKGTSVHAGRSGNEEQKFARSMKDLNVYNKNGRFTHYMVDYFMGDYKINIAHHIGSTSRQNSETTAITAEIHELCTDIAKWEKKPVLPHYVVRAHRHRACGVSFPMKDDHNIKGVILPAWQVKTDFVFKVAARIKYVHIGGHYIGIDHKGDIVDKPFVRTIGLQAEEFHA